MFNHKKHNNMTLYSKIKKLSFTADVYIQLHFDASNKLHIRCQFSNVTKWLLRSKVSLCFVVALIDMFDNTEEAKNTDIVSNWQQKKTLCLTKCFFIFSHSSLFKRATFRSLQIKCEKLYFDEISLINFYFLIFFLLLLLYKNFNTSS